MRIFSVKQPWEELTFRFGFEQALTLVDESIGAVDGVSIVDLEDLETDLADAMYDETQSSFSGYYAYVRVKGGVSGHRYKITVRVTSDTSAQKCELEAILPVRDL
jgi:hypothetical protein